MKKSPDQTREERIDRISAAINLKVPDRVPIMLALDLPFFARYIGVTVQELTYNYEKLAPAVEKFMKQFPELDLPPAAGVMTGAVTDALGQVLWKMPGRHLPPNARRQFVESCNMKTDEYEMFIEDPTDFLLTKYFPRVFKEEWDKGPNRAMVAMMKGVFAHLDSGSFWGPVMHKWEKEFGYVLPAGGMTKAPFDVISDELRGLRESSLDLYRRPEMVIKACEALVPYCLKFAELPSTIRPRPKSSQKELDPWVGIPLHRGCVPFMSIKQFEKFYWPTLKKVLLKLIEDGFICMPFAEGDWTMNLKYWLEIPRAKVVLKIDRGDIFNAKELLRNHTCLQGNVPPSLLEFGTPYEVEKYCKKLIDIVGEDGGFIMDTSADIHENAKIENIAAMIRFTAKYGKYRR